MSVSGLARALTNKKYRPWLVVVIVAATLGLFTHFFASHPQYLRELAHIPPQRIILILALYGLSVGCLSWANTAMLELCGHRIPFKENALLTAYSSIANFFGPLQSGPGVRAVYLKTKWHVRLRDYTLANLIYYGIFASLSMLFLLVGTRPLWQTALALIAVAAFSFLVITWFSGRRHDTSGFALRPRAMATLLAATTLQVSLLATIYFTELRIVNTGISLGQATSYAGAANFALFVSLTPGAIGFREAFLVLSQQLHHISTANILAASVIDRSAYIVFLGLLFLLTLTVHARERLGIRSRASGANQKS